MKLSDRIKRWWAPAKWRDEHPVISDGEGYALSEEQRLADSVDQPGLLGPQSTEQERDFPEPH